MSDSTRALDGLATDAVQKLWDRIEQGNQSENLRGVVVVDLKRLGYKLFADCAFALEYEDGSLVIRQIEVDADGDFSIERLTSAYWASNSFWNYRSDFVTAGLLTASEVEKQEASIRAKKDSERKLEAARAEARELAEYERLKLKYERKQAE